LQEDQANWWKIRKQLDSRLRDLLDEMDDCWFGDNKFSDELRNLFEIDSPATKKGHLFLILDKDLQSLPIESLPQLRGTISISRLPNLALLRDRIDLNKGKSPTTSASPSSTFYILNPAGDLSKTQSKFEKIFEREQDWKGLIGQVPSEDEFREALIQNSILIYCGHGGGESYLKGEKVEKLSNCATSLLMGCSSAQLRNYGKFDPFGVALQYLYAGCPAYVGNLWDVTDGDLDKFTLSMLEESGIFTEDNPINATSSSSQSSKNMKEKEKRRMNLPRAVAESRKVCTLPFLNGASPVVYGMPVDLM